MGKDVRALADGEVIDGRFEVQARVGEGSQGVVYCVLDLGRRRTCALKLLCADEHDSDSRARFRREGRLGLNLRHQNLVEVFETDGLWRRTPYLVMQLLEEFTPLAERWSELDWPRFLAIAEQVASALDYLADYDLVHRDLSPWNILVGDSGAVKVIDLGLAREAGSGLTRSSMIDVMGSPGYLAPEQLERPKSVEPASDQWALASIVYEALTGIPPHFGGGDHEDGAEMSALQRLADGAPLRRPSELNSTVGPALDATVLRALSTATSERFPSSSLFVAALRRAPCAALRLLRSMNSSE